MNDRSKDPERSREVAQRYSFGTLHIAIDIDGSFDRPREMLDYMAASAAAVMAVETIQLGLSASSNQQETERAERFNLPMEFGDGIKVGIKVDCQLEHHISKRQLNDLVFGGILPTILQAAVVYLGDNQQYTTPQQPLFSVSRSENRFITQQALGIMPSRPTVFDTVEESESAGRGRRELVH